MDTTSHSVKDQREDHSKGGANTGHRLLKNNGLKQKLKQVVRLPKERRRRRCDAQVNFVKLLLLISVRIKKLGEILKQTTE